MLADTLIAAGGKAADHKLYSGHLASISGIQEPRRGWLLCNGAAISRATYSKLFALLGTTYGAGDGSTTFNLPNYLDRLMLFPGSTKTTAQTGGALGHTHTLESHGHSLQGHTHSSAHQHTLSNHTHGAATSGPSATFTSRAGTSAVASPTHTHTLTTGGPSPDLTGGASIATTSAPNISFGGNSSPTTTAADVPTLVVGAVLVRYA